MLLECCSRGAQSSHRGIQEEVVGLRHFWRYQEDAAGGQEVGLTVCECAVVMEELEG